MIAVRRERAAVEFHDEKAAAVRFLDHAVIAVSVIHRVVRHNHGAFSLPLGTVHVKTEGYLFFPRAAVDAIAVLTELFLPEHLRLRRHSAIFQQNGFFKNFLSPFLPRGNIRNLFPFSRDRRSAERKPDRFPKNHSDCLRRKRHLHRVGGTMYQDTAAFYDHTGYDRRK